MAEADGLAVDGEQPAFVRRCELDAVGERAAYGDVQQRVGAVCRQSVDGGTRSTSVPGETARASSSA
jgi:hypothetical protein